MMTLKDKRKKLFYYLRDTGCSINRSELILKFIEKQDKEFIKELKDDMFHNICWDVTKDEAGNSPSYYAFRNGLIRKIIKKYEKRTDKLSGLSLLNKEEEKNGNLKISQQKN